MLLSFHLWTGLFCFFCLHLLFIMIQTVVWLNWLVAIQYGEPHWVDGYGQCCTEYNFNMSLLHVGFCIDPRLWADQEGKNERLPIKCSLVLLLKRELSRTSLVVQWIKIHLPIQGTWVGSLVQEDPTCHGATKPWTAPTKAHLLQSRCSARREATAMRSPSTSRKGSPCSRN